jgi:hypothetical protein
MHHFTCQNKVREKKRGGGGGGGQLHALKFPIECPGHQTLLNCVNETKKNRKNKLCGGNQYLGTNWEHIVLKTLPSPPRLSTSNTQGICLKNEF